MRLCGAAKRLHPEAVHPLVTVFLLNAGTEVHCDAAVGDYALIYTNSVVRTGATVGSFARIGSNATVCNHATVPDGADIPDCTAVH